MNLVLLLNYQSQQLIINQTAYQKYQQNQKKCLINVKLIDSGILDVVIYTNQCFKFNCFDNYCYFNKQKYSFEYDILNYTFDFTNSQILVQTLKIYDMHFDFNLDFIVKNDHYESLFLQRFILFIQIISMLSISYTGLKSITYYFESQLEVQLNILQFVFIMISSFIQLIFILEIIDSFSFFSKPFTLIFILQIGLFFPPLILMSIYLRTQILQYQTRVQQILAGVTLLSVLLSPVYPFLVIFMVSSDETIFLIHQIIMCYPIISYLLISDKIKIKLLRTRFFAFYLSDYALKQVFAFFIFCQSSKISRYDRQNENILEIVSLINLIAILTPKIRFKTKFRLSNKINLNLQRQGDCIQCPICLEIIDYNDKNSFLQAPCAHIFHQNCILSWVEYNASCPVCREKLAK